MAHGGLQALGLAVALGGWGALLVATLLPQWEVNSLVGGTIITAVSTSQGLWMACASQSTGQIQCKAFDSILALPGPLQAARALMVMSVVLGPLALALATAGMKCTRCGEGQPRTKARAAAGGGSLFILSGLAGLIAGSWYGHLIITRFYDPLVPVNAKFELGPAIFLCWAGAALALLGGALLSCSCPGSARGRAYPPRGGKSPGGRGPPSHSEYV